MSRSRLSAVTLESVDATQIQNEANLDRVPGIAVEGSAVKDRADDFAGLYREHQRLVRSVIYQIAGAEVLDDLVQDAFVRIWKGLAGFRRDSKLSSWVYRVSVNVALDHCRGRSRSRENENDLAIERAQAPGRHDVAFEARDIVQKGLETLSDDHRAVLVLALIHDVPLAEIADLLDVSEGTVKSRLHYAKQKLRSYLAAHGVDL